MKTVYYKGKSYTYKVMGDVKDERQFSLYNNDGLLMHFVAERDLDKRPSLLSNIVSLYYKTIMEEQPSMF
ncbi:hypothetical protein [Pseudochryseolinea flava]|nr:hypothetical protein [Pseudochryseolinea flava]